MGPSLVYMFPLCLGYFCGYGLSLYFHAIRGCSVLTLEGSPLGGLILADCSTYSYHPTTKKELVFCCNTAWPMYKDGGKWPLNGS